MERAILLDTSVAMEVREGITTVFTVIEYPKALEKNFEILWPENEDMAYAIEISARLYQRGKPIPATDVLIASMAIRRNMQLQTKDGHFRYVKESEPELDVDIKR